jgi:hypothetical protein
LGVVHPDKPGVYLAGIECDGAMYHSSATARERDKIRQSVLEGLGWTLFRVWSTDWWTHRAKALDTLHEALEDLLEADRQEREEATRAVEANTATQPYHPALVDDSNEEIAPLISPVDENVDYTEASRPDFESQSSYLAAHLARPQPSIGEVPSSGISESTGGVFGKSDHTYVVARFDDGNHEADPDLFYSDEYLPRLAAMIDHVIDTEGPIHEDVLIRRIARHHGFQRAGRQIREIILEVAMRRRGRTKEDVGLFFWRKGTVKDHLVQSRYEGRDDEMRKVEYICKEEIAAIRTRLSLSDDPIEIARCIGIARLSQSARDRISEALS